MEESQNERAMTPQPDFLCDDALAKKCPPSPCSSAVTLTNRCMQFKQKTGSTSQAETHIQCILKALEYIGQIPGKQTRMKEMAKFTFLVRISHTRS